MFSAEEFKNALGGQIRRARESLRRAVVTRRCLPNGVPRSRTAIPCGSRQPAGCVSLRGCGAGEATSPEGAANPWKQAVHANRTDRASQGPRTADREPVRNFFGDPTDGSESVGTLL